jgi:hypothetical protein
MNGIAEILASRRCPGFIVRSGFTEQRELENESAKQILKACREIEEREGSRFSDGLDDITPNMIKEVWQNEISDVRRNSITERYDERAARAEEKLSKIDETS